MEHPHRLKEEGRGGKGRVHCYLGKGVSSSTPPGKKQQLIMRKERKERGGKDYDPSPSKRRRGKRESFVHFQKRGGRKERREEL